MRSSAAKVDTKSIAARQCFLCKANRPPQQQDLIFNDRYTILVNPFPIFSRHLTISCEKHTDQRIGNNFDDMLTLAKALPGYVIFYNGPQCGASAPDHLHFQAGNSEFLPIVKDFTESTHPEKAGVKSGIEIWQWKEYLRGIITLKAMRREGLLKAFDYFYKKLTDIQPDKPEPMLNILAYFDTQGWIIHIIPRRIHRPAQFFLEGRDQILLSPASVDIGGVIITPREEDFDRLSKDDAADIFRQVCFDEDELSRLISLYL
jgi:galactose-1-phosphate uridylyltransferase